MTKETAQSKFNHEAYFQVAGIHCASCELIIERKLLELPGINNVAVAREEVLIEYSGSIPDKDQLSKLFASEGYKFFDKVGESNLKKEPVNWLVVFLGIVLASLLYLLVNKLGLISLIRVDASSSLPSFFIFGILAGFSTCAALIGGVVLSLAKNWSSDQGNKITSHLLFYLGRVISFSLLGAVLGMVGKLFVISPIVSAALIIVVALYLIMAALKMFGLQHLSRIDFRLPRFITRFAADSQSGFHPFLIGALTFILPCGFTLTTEGLALLSGSPLQGAAIMLAFALGTVIPLLLIGVGSGKLFENKALSASFSRIAGIILLVFALYNINAGLNIMGLKMNISDKNSGQSTIDNNIQVIRMTANASGYSPAYFKVKAGIPVRWEIADNGASGCTDAIISKTLFPDQIKLERGKTAVKVFMPEKPGKHRFSCWMGMISGVIEVIQ